MNELKKTSDFLHRAIQGLYICSFVATIIFALMAFGCLFLPDSSFYGSTESIAIGPLTMEIKPDGMLAPIWARLDSFWPILGRAVLAFFVCRLLRVLDRILEPMSLGKPFEPSVAPSLKKLAWFSLIGGVSYEMCTNIWPAIVLSRRNLETYFNMDIVQDISLDHSMNLWFLPIFLFLMLMGHVFEYGQKLQQLSDETL